jgi:hypothetical protein
MEYSTTELIKMMFVVLAMLKIVFFCIMIPYNWVGDYKRFGGTLYPVN